MMIDERGLRRPERLLQALDTVAHLAVLPANWDSYGSEPIQREAIHAARQLLTITDFEMLPAPHIAPVPGGGIEIEFAQAGRELEFSIYPDGLIEYGRFVDNNEIDEGDDSPLNLEDTKRVQDLVCWLTGKRDS